MKIAYYQSEDTEKFIKVKVLGKRRDGQLSYYLIEFSNKHRKEVRPYDLFMEEGGDD